jgi:hypothetical protein
VKEAKAKDTLPEAEAKLGKHVVSCQGCWPKSIGRAFAAGLCVTGQQLWHQGELARKRKPGEVSHAE